jgi:hypothetical protein
MRRVGQAEAAGAWRPQDSDTLVPSDFRRLALLLRPSPPKIERICATGPPARAIRGENDIMAIYQSMQRVRFRSAGDYEQFKLIFAGVRHHLKTLPGFLQHGKAVGRFRHPGEVEALRTWLGKRVLLLAPVAS